MNLLGFAGSTTSDALGKAIRRKIIVTRTPRPKANVCPYFVKNGYIRLVVSDYFLNALFSSMMSTKAMEASSMRLVMLSILLTM